MASGGNIINIKPMAIGILVEPELKELMVSGMPGMKYPSATPMAMAINIQRVRYESKKLSFLFVVIVCFFYCFLGLLFRPKEKSTFEKNALNNVKPYLMSVFYWIFCIRLIFCCRIKGEIFP